SLFQLRQGTDDAVARKCATGTDYPNPSSLCLRTRSGRNKNDQVLAREKVEDPLEAKAHRFDFRTHSREGHFMFGFDGNSRIFPAILNEHKASVCFYRLTDLSHRLFWIR